jgi:hypothetical protein
VIVMGDPQVLAMYAAKHEPAGTWDVTGFNISGSNA